MATLSIDFDRAVAAARADGNAALVDHLEALRPRINWNDDGGKFHALAGAEGDNITAAVEALGGDVFDIATTTLSVVMRVIDNLGDRGLDKPSALYAMIKSLSEIARHADD